MNRIILLILIIMQTWLCFSVNIVTASEQQNSDKKLSQSESQQLLEDVQYLLSDKETIDYHDPKLNKILSKYDYDLFKTYKAFIEFDRSDKKQADLNRAKEFLVNYFHKIERYFSWCDSYSDTQNITQKFDCLITGGFLADDIAHLIPGEREKNWDNGHKYIKIPLWLVRKYPNIINTDGVYTLTVNAKNSIKNLREFHEFISDFSKIHSGYLTPMQGPQKINSYLNTKNFIDIVSFNPAQRINSNQRGVCAKKSFPERMLSSEKWSYLSIDNRLKYEKFAQSLYKFSASLSKYYKTHYDLYEYANQADNIISYYVCTHMEGHYDDYDPAL